MSDLSILISRRVNPTILIVLPLMTLIRSSAMTTSCAVIVSRFKLSPYLYTTEPWTKAELIIPSRTHEDKGSDIIIDTARREALARVPCR